MPRGFSAAGCFPAGPGSCRTETIYSISFFTQRSHSADRSWYGCWEKIRERVFASSSPAGSMTVRVMHGSRAGVVPPLTDRMVANGTTWGWSVVWPLSTRASRWLVRIRSVLGIVDEHPIRGQDNGFAAFHVRAGHG